MTSNLILAWNHNGKGKTFAQSVMSHGCQHNGAEGLFCAATIFFLFLLESFSAKMRSFGVSLFLDLEDATNHQEGTYRHEYERSVDSEITHGEP